MSDARVVLFGLGAGLVAVIAVGLVGRRALQLAGAGLEQVNPLNPNNAIATGVNKLGETISGTPAWSLADWVFGFTDARAAERRMFNDPAGVPSRGASGNW